MHNLQKFRNRRNKTFVDILIFLVFSKSGLQYLWQGEISACKVLAPIKVVMVRNDYFCNPNCIGFCIGAFITEKNIAHILVMSS